MSTSKRHVLCAVDYSASSRTALRYASVAAQQIDATLTVLNVANPLLVAAMQTYGVTGWPVPEREELRAFCRETLGRDDVFEVDVRVGRPEHEIHAVSRTLSADLLVMGSHGLTGVRKMFFGSTAERVLRESDVPVLVTPSDVHAPGTAANIPALVRRIIIAVDLSEESAPLVQLGALVGQSFSVPVVLMHTIEPLGAPPRTHGHLPSLQRVVRERAEASLLELAAGAAGTIEPIVFVGDPAETIVSATETRGAGLIVMGLNHSGARRVGAVAYRVLSRTHVPILALPASAARRLARDLPHPNGSAAALQDK
jgi:nucleotide-binding universal stress UspA family protein